MMHCVFEYLLSACEMHVLPQPKAPGMAHVPPSTEGKSVSMTRWPVMSASRPGSFSSTGRGSRTGHLCVMVTFTVLRSPLSLRTLSSTSVMVSSSRLSVPKPFHSATISPLTLGGTMIMWRVMSSFSYTSPMMVPPVTIMPSRRPLTGVKR